ncbi:MlaC/ttg2D family ABC transporter substrate-binding protein [Shumkonia mesophila]|uniref:MlaC/ttg2D family ABC transporter substrate-binding protein n=1 Tax=Shumkonia mesophila TaxID=2838854 RepID=UPI0029348FF1|nr:ABC transporter substrate-binding protein [Shumkonia mesophila]
MEVKRFRLGKATAAVTAFILAICLAIPPAASAGREDAARQFIASLADRAIQALTTADIPRAERIRRFRTLFNDHFAVEDIGKWVLGRYWSRATPAEQTEYLRLFEDYIVASYVDRFATYTGERLRITRALAEEGERATVFSEIVLPGGGKTPVRIDWRVESGAGQPKITDLVVEGVSMSTTLRSEFGSIMRRDGGKLDGLFAVLREKTAAIKAAQ